VAAFKAVARGALVKVLAASEGCGGIVKATIDAVGGAPPMFKDSMDA
jgi:hypothetical protein